MPPTPGTKEQEEEEQGLKTGYIDMGEYFTSEYF